MSNYPSSYHGQYQLQHQRNGNKRRYVTPVQHSLIQAQQQSNLLYQSHEQQHYIEQQQQHYHDSHRQQQHFQQQPSKHDFSREEQQISQQSQQFHPLDESPQLSSSNVEDIDADFAADGEPILDEEVLAMQHRSVHTAIPVEHDIGFERQRLQQQNDVQTPIFETKSTTDISLDQLNQKPTQQQQEQRRSELYIVQERDLANETLGQIYQAVKSNHDAQLHSEQQREQLNDIQYNLTAIAASNSMIGGLLDGLTGWGSYLSQMVRGSSELESSVHQLEKSSCSDQNIDATRKNTNTCATSETNIQTNRKKYQRDQDTAMPRENQVILDLEQSVSALKHDSYALQQSLRRRNAEIESTHEQIQSQADTTAQHFNRLKRV